MNIASTMEIIKPLLIIVPLIIVSLWLNVESSQLENENNPLERKDLEAKGGYYIAGVVEYKPIPIGSRSPTDAMLENVKHYEELIDNAAENNVDVIVFAEYGITTVGMPSQRGLAREFLVELPKFGSVPCNEEGNTTNYQILHRLSCAAQKRRMYVIANLGELHHCDQSMECPLDGAYHYNTNIVFDRNGSIVARYRKFHLYFEPQFDTPPLEYSTFHTDFGVEFGLFTCFDIIFAHPAVELVALNVKNFAFPTAWVDELPFLTAIQAQSLWAHSNRVNLLASGYHHPERGSMGSGIFSCDQTLNYTFEPTSGTKLVIGSVPIDNEDCGQVTPALNKKDVQSSTNRKYSADEKPIPYHMWLREDLSNYTHKLLDPNLTEDSLCHLDLLCCNFKYDLILPHDHVSGYFGHFRLLAFEGQRTVAAKTDNFEWQVCAVVHCLNETLESCTELDKPQSYQHLHPHFKTLGVQMKPLKREEYEDKAAQPALSLIDIHFNLIPQYYFNMRQWKDPQTNTSCVEAVSNSEENMVEVKVKTVGLIQRIYGGRI